MDIVIAFIVGWLFGYVLCDKYGYRFTIMGTNVRIFFKQLKDDIKRRINKIK